MKLQIKSQGKARKVLVAVIVTAVILAARDASAIDLAFGSPTVVGDGSPGTTARFTNVGSQDGVSIDMLATVIDATPGKVGSFSAIGGGNFRFDIGDNDGDRFFKVRYRFLESGTTTPRAINDMAWSIGDLDDTGGRIESVVVQGTAGYLTERTTTLDVNQAAYTISAAGTVDLDEDDPDGNPEGVISFLFQNRAVIQITYQVQGGGGGYFDHDGVGAFPFYSPQQTQMGIYFTFEIVNDEDIPVKMDFSNTLTGNLKWETEFDPVFDGTLGHESDPHGVLTSMLDALAFADSDQTVNFTEISFPPGTTQFTLKTQSTEANGERIANVAMTKPSSNSGFPRTEMMSYSAIDLPNPSPVPPEGPVGTLVESFKANFCSYTLFQIGGDAGNSGSSSIGGDVAVAAGATNSISSGDIAGDIIIHPAEDLTGQVTAAIAVAEDFAALPATQNLGNIDSDTTVNGGAPDGVNVIAINELKLGSSEKFTLSGDGDDWFIINVASKLELTGSSRIVVTGVPPSQVLFNMGPGVSEVKMSGSSGALGISILAPHSVVKLSGSSDIIGSVIVGGDTELTGSAKISGLATFGGSCSGGPGGGPPTDPVDDFIDDFTASDLGRFGWFSIGGTVHMNDWTNTIYGHVGIGPGTLMNFSKGAITGTYTVDPTVTEKNGAVDDLPGTAMGNPISSTIEDLSEYKTNALILNSQAAALPATQTFGEISENFTISGTDPDGFNVIDVETLSMGTGRTFTISGGADDWFIFNISKELKFAGGSVVVSGVPGNQILFNLLPGASEAKFDGAFTLDATVLAPFSAVNLTGTATVTGAIISGMNASMSGQATITQTSPFGR